MTFPKRHCRQVKRKQPRSELGLGSLFLVFYDDDHFVNCGISGGVMVSTLDWLNLYE